VATDLELGGYQDQVLLRLGSEDLKIVESYEVKAGVLQQPGAFTIRLGWGKTAAELIKRYPPGTPFELYIGPTLAMSGLTYGRAQPSSNFTQIEIKGRDYLAVLFDDEIQREYAFTDETYFKLTRKILNVVGLKEDTGDGQGGPTRFVLDDNNDNNRAVVSRVKAKPRQKGEIIELIPTGATTGAGKVFYKSLKARTGTRWFDFLQEQYKFVGLFLMATGSGNFVLFRPRADMDPVCSITRTRGATRKQGDAISCRFQDDTTMRHAAYIVYGRGGSGKEGRDQILGSYVDDEMVAYGFRNCRTITDDDCKSNAEADYIARRTCAEERRAGWQLSYTVSGHTYPSQQANGSFGVWVPDTVCRVDDDELDIHGNFYVESVTYARAPETTTEITLMRPQDLIFADKLFDQKSNVGSTGKSKKRTSTAYVKARQEAAEKFVRDNFGTKAGPPDLLEGLR
jgi:prophage tail gpP-like protein